MTAPCVLALATAALSTRSVTAVARRVSGARLRTLALHDVRDCHAFDMLLDHLLEHYTPVSGAEVRQALEGRRLPRRAVWLTFDDAHPDVIELALPRLVAAGVPACLFVCPAVVDTGEPYWFQTVDIALRHNMHHDLAGPLSKGAFRASLKQLPDGERRAVVSDLRRRLEEVGVSASVPQVTTQQLEAWARHGLEVGNHSWDHPLLDRCDDAGQRGQVAQADDALRQRGLLPARGAWFAYPNGNAAKAAEQELDLRGYGPPLMFDHALTALDRARLSRLRLDAYAPLPRVRAVLSGAHSTAFACFGGASRG